MDLKRYISPQWLLSLSVGIITWAGMAVKARSDEYILSEFPNELLAIVDPFSKTTLFTASEKFKSKKNMKNVWWIYITWACAFFSTQFSSIFLIAFDVVSAMWVEI